MSADDIDNWDEIAEVADQATDAADSAGEAAEAGGRSMPNPTGLFDSLGLTEDTADVELERLHKSIGLSPPQARVVRVAMSYLPGGDDADALLGGDGRPSRIGDLFAAGIDAVKMKMHQRRQGGNDE